MREGARNACACFFKAHWAQRNAVWLSHLARACPAHPHLDVGTRGLLLNEAGKEGATPAVLKAHASSAAPFPQLKPARPLFSTHCCWCAAAQCGPAARCSAAAEGRLAVAKFVTLKHLSHTADSLRAPCPPGCKSATISRCGVGVAATHHSDMATAFMRPCLCHRFHNSFLSITLDRSYSIVQRIANTGSHHQCHVDSVQRARQQLG